MVLDLDISCFESISIPITELECYVNMGSSIRDGRSTPQSVDRMDECCWTLDSTILTQRISRTQRTVLVPIRCEESRIEDRSRYCTRNIIRVLCGTLVGISNREYMTGRHRKIYIKYSSYVDMRCTWELSTDLPISSR